jgi:hypothetical protein
MKKKTLHTLTSGIIFLCVMLNGAAAQLQPSTLDAELFSSAFSVQTPLINLFICGSLPLRIVSAYFIKFNGLHQRSEKAPGKKTKERSNTASSAILHDQKLAEKKLSAKRLLPFSGGSAQIRSEASAVVRNIGQPMTPLLFQQCFAILVLLFIFLLPRSSTNENGAGLFRQI